MYTYIDDLYCMKRIYDQKRWPIFIKNAMKVPVTKYGIIVFVDILRIEMLIVFFSFFPVFLTVILQYGGKLQYFEPKLNTLFLF